MECAGPRAARGHGGPGQRDEEVVPPWPEQHVVLERVCADAELLDLLGLEQLEARVVAQHRARVRRRKAVPSSCVSLAPLRRPPTLLPIAYRLLLLPPTPRFPPGGVCVLCCLSTPSLFFPSLGGV